ncbi:hypothetical protein [Malacoplasma penetrans]|nr:hypothetical protein [Malacoplasma penetrans]
MVIEDKDAITIQIYKIRPHFNPNESLDDFDQYMFAIHVPEEWYVKTFYK